VTLTVSDVSENFTLTTRSAEPSGLFEGTGTVNGLTSLGAVKVMIRNESILMFDEAESVLYDGDIVSYEGNDFTAEFDVYEQGELTSEQVSATGSILAQTSIAFTLSGTGYGNGSINATYNVAFTDTPSNAAFAASFPDVWSGETNTVNDIGQYFWLRAPVDDSTFRGGPTDCSYATGIKTISDDTINLYDLDFDAENEGSATCDHAGEDYQGFATIIEGTDDIMWFAATNGTYSTFTVLTYQDN
jgi:hypothetical protein